MTDAIAQSALWVILAVFAAVMVLRIATQYERSVVFRLGRYQRTAGPGLYLLLPILDRQVKLDLRTITRASRPRRASRATTCRSRSTA